MPDVVPPSRRDLLSAGAAALPALAGLPPAARATFTIDPGLRTGWLERWRRNILAEARNRYCDSTMGEAIGWLMSPLLEGFYYGHAATGDAAWIDRLVDWTEAWVRRGVTDPDGYVGWPRIEDIGPATGLGHHDRFDTDSLLGEAMVLRPVVLAAAAILKDPALSGRHGRAAHGYLALARRLFEKWDRRGVWRATGAGMISVVLPYGIDPRTGGWTEGFRDRNDPRAGLSHPDNKANMVAMWLLAMSDATGETAYRTRAAAWFRVMKSRMQPQADGTWRIWNYWEPAGAWDYGILGLPKHWVGIHPRAGYYAIDVRAIVAAWHHDSVFTNDDIARLVRTEAATARLWPALAPCDAATRARFERMLNPDGWDGLALVPWYLAQQPTGYGCRCAFILLDMRFRHPLNKRTCYFL